MTQTSLYTYTQDGFDISKNSAFKNILPSQAAIGFAYTPHNCLFFKFRDGDLVDESGLDITWLSQAYEIRIFCDNWELRWLRDGETGALALLSNQNLSLSDGFAVNEFKDMYCRDNSYLLWGELSKDNDPTSGWTCVSTARIGKLSIPWSSTDLTEKDRIKLKTIEYFQNSEDGNVVYFDERLCGFEIYDHQKEAA